MKNFKPDVPVALLSGDEHLPPSELEAVDCFMPKSEPISSLLEKVDYLLSMRLVFRPFDTLKAEHAGGRVAGHETGPDLHRSTGISVKNGGIQETL